MSDRELVWCGTDRSKAVLLLRIFYVFVLSCVCYVLCASVYMCFVVTCWERADLLALVCGVFCEFVTFPLVSWVRCGTWLYRFLIFATLLTLHSTSRHIWEWYWISRHVWYNDTSVQVAPDLLTSFFHLHPTSKISVAVAIDDQQAWPIVRYHVNRHCI